MAESNYKKSLHGEMVKAKKYFYVLRPILACQWILETGTPPPMPFAELMESQLEEDLKETVCKLLDIKMNAPEVKMIPRIDVLNAYLDRSIIEIKKMIERLPEVSGSIPLISTKSSENSFVARKLSQLPTYSPQKYPACPFVDKPGFFISY